MAYLVEVENVIKNVIQKLDGHPVKNNSDLEECWIAYSAGNMMLLRKWQESKDVGETLAKLLMDDDRRAVVLSMLYLGRMKNLIENVNRAIDRINYLANQSDDKTIGMATGIANAMLGHEPAIRWVSSECNRLNYSSVDEFYKHIQLTILMNIAEGWK